LIDISERKTISSIGAIESSLSVYLNDLLEMITSEKGIAPDAAESVLKIILYRIFYVRGVSSKKVTRKESYILTIERIINQNSTDSQGGVSLDLISKELNLCKKQASRVIIEHYGKPLYALVLEKKLTVACELLIETELSVSEIARRTNFETENYFFKKFKAAYGITPLQYRKKRRN
jgi:AraC-like DNA-binding protein